MFVFVGIIFAFSVLSYIGLSFGYKPYLESSIQNIESEFNSLSLQIESKNQKNFVEFYSQVANLKSLLASHVQTSKVLPLLEQSTHPQVSYSAINLLVKDRSLAIDGYAASYDVLAAQLASYEQATWVDRVILNSSAVSDKTVRFSIKLNIKDETIKL
ncbi:MAG: hypothetical protein A3E61_02335 [Candidatus Colwellbacteria bacterium RIFCSPHIGHO2_12_FULL_43_12]|uniref:Uncharacterized protein n=3 Tax=Candidatus Colwelliibacteriota TaxID=1817904 RepID=A0A1G1YXK6_9BACT|nr:MAG: hypothetical protein A3D47_00370 [Candidatus Colwellbacteria bacterium RIFCSPHIGHO2_02_FULL_43_15]OGY59101.1 MAG: hypothetical protein A3E61_02335 [Candidatus Colwellbacteria bacterium RIFCSPHIGHO2_12_FULL_43_12]OGY60651.1 MAG: hypothetical protein A3F99_01465 [Candidatus Colwellbacteria bacterium RIFCSPLOWO2_12_FULL_43_11]